MSTYWKNLIVLGLLAWICSCTYDQIEPIKIPQPRTPVQTDELQASYVPDLVPNTINSPYWLTSDFVTILPQDITTNQVASEIALLNVNGTYNGLSDFSEGTDLELVLKAAYDDTYLYLLASWKDESVNLSQHSWLYNGPEDPLKMESAAGWTSQRNDDNILFEFDMGNGNFDVWKWSLALSEPLGFALDMYHDGTNTIFDSGDKMFVRNINGTGNDAGPMYEWNGAQQDFERASGGFTILDPGFYLLNKEVFTGDVVNGAALYQQECASCHGVNGDGDGFDWDTGIAMNGPGLLNRLSREGFANFTLSAQHDGASHFEVLDPQERDDLMAMIRGFSGVPGYFLENPTGSNSDVSAISNIQLAKVSTKSTNEDGYSVLFIRELTTANSDDIQLTEPEGMSINFNVYLTNNDDINRVGSVSETLIFKEK